MQSPKARIFAQMSLAVAVLAASAGGQSGDQLTDEALAHSIQRGVRWLLSQQNEHGHWERLSDQPPLPDRGPSYYGGNTALACLALLYARIPPEHPQLAQGLDSLVDLEANATYVYGIRCHVFALAELKRYHQPCQHDLSWLLRTVGKGQDDSFAGTYDYTAPYDDQPRRRYDNSNSQYGLLGVWAGAEAGYNVPEQYWRLTERHWLADQRPDGGWNYQGAERDSYGSMTAAGVASLYVVLDHLYTPLAASSERELADQADQLLQAIDRGLDWLGRHYRADLHPPNRGEQWLFYYLYSVERVGHASGRKYFNEQDWFRQGANQLLNLQMSDGGWPGGYGIATANHVDARIVNTAFALMFLTRGSGPVLFNKLERSELARTWRAFPRDLAHLARYAERTLERHVNWQVVSLTVPVESLHDAPVLYISGIGDWEWHPQEIEKLRAYLQQGGLILATAGRPDKASEQAFRELAEQLCPQVPVRAVEAGHPLFTQRVHTAIDKPPAMLEVHNDIRPLLLFCPRPIHMVWHGNEVQAHGELFALGTNIYLYATDRSVRQTRLTTHILPEAAAPKAQTIRLARIRYRGPWDPEPFGWEQLRRDLARDRVADLQVTVGVALDEPRLEAYELAHLTGTGRFAPNPQEFDGLIRFLEKGGTLVADAAGGREDFDATFRAHLREAFGPNALRAVPIDHQLWTGPPGGQDLRSARTRRTRSPASTGAGVGRRGGPRLEAVTLGGRLAVIYSPIDLSAGMVGQPIFNCPGVRPPQARQLMRNLLLFAAHSQANTPKPARP